MTYKASQLADFFMIAVVLTAASLLALPYAVQVLFGHGQAVHDLLFRTYIQWATLGVFFFAVTMLVHRVLYYRSSILPGLRALAHGRSLQKAAPIVAQRYDRVRHCKETEGATAAANYNRELAERDDEALRHIYHLIGSAAGLMLALWFFGTVWGIGQRMFGSGAFDLLSGAWATNLKSFLGNFTDDLSTALDTTILGMICGLVVTVFMHITQWLETNALRLLDDTVRQQLSLETALHTRDAGLVELVERKLTASVEALLRQFEATTRALTAHAVELWNSKLQAAMDQQFAHMQAYQRQMFDELSAAVQQQTAHTLEMLQEQGTQLRTTCTAELQSIAHSLVEMQAATHQWLERVAEHEQRCFAPLSAALAAQAQLTMQALEMQRAQAEACLSELQAIRHQLQRQPEISIRYPNSNGTDGLLPALVGRE